MNSSAMLVVRGVEEYRRNEESKNQVRRQIEPGPSRNESKRGPAQSEQGRIRDVCPPGHQREKRCPKQKAQDDLENQHRREPPSRQGSSNRRAAQPTRIRGRRGRYGFTITLIASRSFMAR